MSRVLFLSLSLFLPSSRTSCSKTVNLNFPCLFFPFAFHSTNSIPTSAQPTDLESTPGGEYVLVSTTDGVDILSKGKKIFSRLFKGEKVLSVAAGKSAEGEILVAVGFEASLFSSHLSFLRPSSLALSPLLPSAVRTNAEPSSFASLVASQSKTIQLFVLSSGSIDKFSSDAPAVTFSENKGAVYALNFSPEGDLLAAGDVRVLSSFPLLLDTRYKSFRPADLLPLSSFVLRRCSPRERSKSTILRRRR